MTFLWRISFSWCFKPFCLLFKSNVWYPKSLTEARKYLQSNTKIINVEIPPLNAKMPTPFRLQWSCSYSVPCNQLYHRETEREQKFRKFSQFVVWIYTRCSGTSYTEVEFLCEPHVGTQPILILFVYPCLCLMMKYLSSTSSSQGKTCLCHPWV